MSSTNKTAKLELSQFLGTDKPAWLGDYNSDMQKIDDAFADLEQGGQSSAADIAALQQKDDELTQNITDVNDRVDTTTADLIAVGNRTTVLEGNYDTMHHELVLNNETIKEHDEELSELKEDVDELLSAETRNIFLDTLSGSDDNDGLSSSTPIKTIKRAQEIMLQRQSISRLRIKAGTTIVIDSSLFLTTMSNFDKYGDGENPVIQFTAGLNVTTTAYFSFNNLTFEYVRDNTNAYINFYAADLSFTNCKFIGKNTNIALFTAARFAGSTFDINILNAIGGMLVIRDTVGGTINKIGGYGSIINIDEANVTVGSYVGTCIKNVLQ